MIEGSERRQYVARDKLQGARPLWQENYPYAETNQEGCIARIISLTPFNS